MLTRDVYFIARPVVFKMCYSECSWRSHFFCWCRESWVFIQ